MFDRRRDFQLVDQTFRDKVFSQLSERVELLHGDVVAVTDGRGHVDAGEATGSDQLLVLVTVGEDQ